MNEMPEMTFEEGMKRLEEIVAILERGEISLEESLKLYREGSLCSRLCKEKLSQAEHEIKIWQEGEPEESQAAWNFEEVPF